MKKYTYYLILLVISFGLKAQNTDTEKLQQALQILQTRGEIVVKFNITTKAQINEDLTNIMSIDHVKELPNGQGYEVRAYANLQEFQAFLTRNIPYEIIPKNIPKALTMATTVAQMANWDRYPIYSVYEQMMANFATNYPALCNIDTILSTTPSGNYRILVARISDNVNTPENEPQLLFSSSMHGDETTGYYLMLRMINYLLTNYGSIQQVTTLVNGAEIWICPLANPEGTYYNSSPAGSTVANSRRGNLAGVDLNRNYPDPRDGQNPDGYAWQPETVAFMNFADLHHFNFGANFHGGAEVMNYPWDTWTTTGNSNADRLWWEHICTDYVATARQVSSSYMSDATVAADGVTEGGDWYVITGGRQDYMNFYKQCREVTIELDDEKTTATENLQGMWNINYNSLLNLMQESLYGVRGVITDSCSGQPIRAKVWVNSYDQVNDSSQVYSALPVGNYHKYMIAGTYSITYSAPGYTSKTVNNVVLANSSATVVNVSLAPAASPDAQFAGTITDKCSGTVQFTNTSTASDNFVWYFGDGSTSTLANPSHSYSNNGTYTVKLKAFNCKGIDSLVRTSYIVIADMALTPSVTNGSNCGPGTVSLSATALGTVKWYDAASGGNLINTGTTYNTPYLSNTTTYYVENDERGNVETAGKTFVQSGGAGTSTGEHYLIFDAYTSLTLISVKVYNTSTSTVSKTIALKNSSGTIINGQSITVSIPSGLSTVSLNFAVPAGTNMRLTCTSGVSLYRHNYGVSYSYTTPGLLSITGSDAGSTYYYYFYEWLVQKDACVSSRVPAVASILTVPTAGFSSSVSTYTATFTNTSTNSTGYAWNFGDGGTSAQQNPVHTYATSGTYNVRLITTNGSCSDTIYHNVTITAGSNYSITGKTRYLSKATAGIAPGMPTYNPAIYNIGKVLVILKSSPAGIELARDTTNSQGVFQFNNVANGNYILSYDKYTADTMQMCNDVNAIDLAIMKYLVGHDTTSDPSRKFSAKHLKAANVDNNATINSIDIARMSAKIGQPYSASANFPKGNWVAFDTAVTVAGANLNLTLKTIGYGDYNASSTSYKDSVNTWSTAKNLEKNTILISSEETSVINDPSYVEISLTSSNLISDFAALGLELNYSAEDYKLVSAVMSNNKTKGTSTKINPSLEEIIAENNDLLVTDDNGVIRVVYATTNIFDVKAHDTVITLGFISRNGINPGMIDIITSGTGVIGDQYGNEVTDAYLIMPKIFLQNDANHQETLYFEGHPNPVNDNATILFNLPENGTVTLKVFNAIGEQVAILMNETCQRGKNQTEFSAKNLRDGFYTLKLEFAGSEKSGCHILKMIVQHR